MEIKIKNKTHKVTFGIRFIRALDDIHYIEREGIRFGAGLDIAIPLLASKNPVALADVLFAGTKNLTMNQVETYIEDQAEEGNLEGLFDEVGKELSEAPLTKDRYAIVEEMLKEDK